MSIDSSLFRASLITKGRKSGLSHSVTLRGVKYNEKIYFSRHRPDSDWFKNAKKNSEVVIRFNDSLFSGNAKIVIDDELNQKISHLKYPGEKRAEEKRVSLEITLHEQL
ncbi:MAG: nitroreductase/quinone reductase family protein [Nitrosopumilus sp.]|nr:nitroreductase/quinone reductase family protein [Nitrosopumilus sp.]